jgi:hypothetical protein
LHFTPSHVAKRKCVVEIKEGKARGTTKVTQVFIKTGAEISRFVVKTEEKLRPQIEERLRFGSGQYVLRPKMKEGTGWRTLELTMTEKEGTRRTSEWMMILDERTEEELRELTARISGIPREQITLKDSRGRELQKIENGRPVHITYGWLNGGGEEIEVIRDSEENMHWVKVKPDAQVKDIMLAKRYNRLVVAP